MSKKQYPVLLHSHSHHSDGEYPVEEVVQNALDFGYKGMILTDHNTEAGSKEIREKKLDEKIVVLDGIEWTTTYGHMLVHDANRFVDYRTATLDNIDEKIEEVKKANGLVGIAHPYRIGSPMCTGCHWTFEVQKWENVDYIEIYNKTNPHTHFWSGKAYRLWTEKLKEGYKIAATAGRDWHRLEGKGANPAVTYVQPTDNWSPNAFKDALKKGQMYFTLAPKIQVSVEKNGEEYSFGDSPTTGNYTVKIDVEEADIPQLAALDIEPKLLGVIENEKVIQKQDLTKEKSLSFEYEATDNRYLRFEIVGRYANRENVRLTITSPIYFE